MKRPLFMDWRLWCGLGAAGLLLFASLSFFNREPNRGRGPVGAASAGREDRSAMLASAVTTLGELETQTASVAYQQVADRLNQWYLSLPSDADWKLDKTAEQLPKRHQSFFKSLSANEYRSTISDGVYLAETVVMRDIAKSVCKESNDPLEEARLLFDWTVRELQLAPDRRADDRRPRRRALDLLMRGSATTMERAWVFLLLARQRRLEAAVLEVGDPDKPDELRLWTVAVLVDGEAYLFDPRLGLPIPVPGGKPNEIATLNRAATDAAVLDALDIGSEFTYDVHKADLEKVAAFIEVPPHSLTRRMRAIENALAGDERFVATSNPPAALQRWRSVSHLAKADVWFTSWEHYREAVLREKEGILFEKRYEGYFEDRNGDLFLDREGQYNMDDPDLAFGDLPDLRPARLAHLKGNITGTARRMNFDSANAFYLRARVTEEFIDNNVRRTRPSRRRRVRSSNYWGRRSATYWLGIAAFDAGNYDTAIGHLERRCIGEDADTPWLAGAHYNLARTYEALENPAEAIKHLGFKDTPQLHGNLLRARLLTERQSAGSILSEGAGQASDAPQEAAPTEPAPNEPAPNTTKPKESPSPGSSP